MLLLLLALLAARRSAKATAPLAQALAQLGQSVQTLDQGQQQLTGGLRHVSEAQAIAQSKMVETMERRLEEVQKNMGESLHGSSQRTTRSLAELQETISRGIESFINLIAIYLLKTILLPLGFFYALLLVIRQLWRFDLREPATGEGN